MVYPLYPVTDDIYSLQHFHHLYTSSLTVYDIFSILVQCTLEPNNFGRTSFKLCEKHSFPEYGLQCKYDYSLETCEYGGR